MSLKVMAASVGQGANATLSIIRTSRTITIDREKLADRIDELMPPRTGPFAFRKKRPRLKTDFDTEMYHVKDQRDRLDCLVTEKTVRLLVHLAIYHTNDAQDKGYARTYRCDFRPSNIQTSAKLSNIQRSISKSAPLFDVQTTAKDNSKLWQRQGPESIETIMS